MVRHGAIVCNTDVECDMAGEILVVDDWWCYWHRDVWRNTLQDAVLLYYNLVFINIYLRVDEARLMLLQWLQVLDVQSILYIKYRDASHRGQNSLKMSFKIKEHFLFFFTAQNFLKSRHFQQNFLNSGNFTENLYLWFKQQLLWKNHFEFQLDWI